jgi:hypothetical protein
MRDRSLLSCRSASLTQRPIGLAAARLPSSVPTVAALGAATHTPEAPWYIVPADDKRRARLNLIRHLLDSTPYNKIPKSQPRPKGATERLGAGEPIPSYY